MAKAKKKRTSKKSVKTSKKVKSTKTARATKIVKVSKASKTTKASKAAKAIKKGAAAKRPMPSRFVTPEAPVIREASAEGVSQQTERDDRQGSNGRQPSGDLVGSAVKTNEPQPECIRSAMDQAWRDVHQVRNQSWQAVKLVFVLGAGLVSVDVVLGNMVATVAAGVLVVAASAAGMGVALYHRDVELKNLARIGNFEKALGLLRLDLIDETEQRQLPHRVVFRDVFTFSGSTSTLFILRMHTAMALLAVVFVVVRCWRGY